MKNLEEKHQRIISQYDQEKSKHLERQADQLLKNDQNAEELRQYKMKGDFFELFN